MTAILLAALGAGAIAFISSIATQTGACNIPGANPAEVGMLGGALKASHTAFLALRGTMNT